MGFCDFVVKYDPAKDTTKDITERILYSLFVKRLKQKKPAVTFLSGDSGEGKSYGAIAFMDVLLKVQGLDLKDYFKDVNVMVPLEYPKKLDALLFKKELKKVNFLCMHEAREIIKSKMWRSFLAQSVADCNAMSRQIKPLGIFIISQFIRDITTDVRYTLNFYIKMRRPRGKPARAYISIVWKDDSDLEKPKLRKRRIMGYLQYPNGRRQKYIPQYLEILHPRKELTELFEKMDYEAKATIIRGKLNKQLKEMQEDLGDIGNKVDTMVEWYTTHIESLQLIGKRHAGKLRVSPDFRAMHDLSEIEVKQFETKINEALKKKGFIPEETAASATEDMLSCEDADNEG